MSQPTSLHITERIIKEDTFSTKIVPAIFSSLLYFVIAFYMFRLFAVENFSIITLVLSWLFVTVYFFIPAGRMKKNLYLFSMVAIVLLLLIGRSTVTKGLSYIYNHFVEQIGLASGRVYPQIEVANNSTEVYLSYQFISGLIFIVLAILCYWIIDRGKLFVLILLYALLVGYQLMFSTSVGLAYEIGLISVILFSLLYHNIQSSSSHIVFKNSLFTFIGSLTILIVFFVLAMSVTYFISPKEAYTKYKAVEDAENRIVDAISAWRFGKSEPSALYYGDLNKLTDVETSDEAVLEVIMEYPTPLYLKGYIGVDYKENGWEDLDEEVAYRNHGLFYWLEEESFDVSHQLSYVNLLTQAIEEDTYEMTVYNIKESAELLFYPYELASPIEEVKESLKYRDTNKYSASFSGERLYTYDIMPNLIRKYPRMANILYKQSSSEVEAYEKSEQHYKEFVYENYTEIPEPVALLFTNHLKEKLKNFEDGITYEQAISEVKSFLKETTNYNEKVTSPEENVDVLVDFLENKKEGFAPHYATTATLLFRFLGIPSRYVEGYLITPKDVRDVEPYEKIVLPNSNAHAWTEIYIDRLGWIPIEVTPPYEKVMPPIDLTDYPEGSNPDGFKSQVKQGDGLQGMQKIQSSDDVGHNDQKEETESLPFWKYLLIVLLALIILALLFFIVTLIMRRRRLKQFEKKLREEDERRKVTQRFSYIIRLLDYDGVPLGNGSLERNLPSLNKRYGMRYVQQFREAVLINEKARFSRQAITEEEALLLESLFMETKEQLIASRNRWQRIRMYFIDAVI